MINKTNAIYKNFSSSFPIIPLSKKAWQRITLTALGSLATLALGLAARTYLTPLSPPSPSSPPPSPPPLVLPTNSSTLLLPNPSSIDTRESESETGVWLINAISIAIILGACLIVASQIKPIKEIIPLNPKPLSQKTSPPELGSLIRYLNKKTKLVWTIENSVASANFNSINFLTLNKGEDNPKVSVVKNYKKKEEAETLIENLINKLIEAKIENFVVKGSCFTIPPKEVQRLCSTLPEPGSSEEKASPDNLTEENQQSLGNLTGNPTFSDHLWEVKKVPDQKTIDSNWCDLVGKTISKTHVNNGNNDNNDLKPFTIEKTQYLATEHLNSENMENFLAMALYQNCNTIIYLADPRQVLNWAEILGASAEKEVLESHKNISLTKFTFFLSKQSTLKTTIFTYLELPSFENFNQMIDLANKNNSGQGPIFICSTQRGRVGKYIAIDSLRKAIQRKEKINVSGRVYEIYRYCGCMLNSPKQLMSIYTTLHASLPHKNENRKKSLNPSGTSSTRKLGWASNQITTS